MIGSTTRNDARNDRQVLLAIGQGETEAVGTLLRRYWAEAYAIARRTTGDPGTAEDAAQEAFVQVLQNAHRFDPTKPFRPWFVQIVFNTARMQSRARSRRAAHEAKAARVDPSSPAPSGEALAVREQLAQLDPGQREAIALHYLSGLTFVEVSEVLGIPTGTIASRIRRGMRRLREAVAPAAAAGLGAATLALAFGSEQAPPAPAVTALRAAARRGPAAGALALAGRSSGRLKFLALGAAALTAIAATAVTTATWLDDPEPPTGLAAAPEAPAPPADPPAPPAVAKTVEAPKPNEPAKAPRPKPTRVAGLVPAAALEIARGLPGADTLRTIKGRLSWRGRAVPRMHVKLEVGPGRHSQAQDTIELDPLECDPEGRFAVQLPTPLRVTLRAYHPIFGALTFRRGAAPEELSELDFEPAPAAETLDLALALRAYVVYGRVLEEGSDRPIVRARIRSRHSPSAVLSDARGRFALLYSDSNELDMVGDAGLYGDSFTVEATGYGVQAYCVEAEGDEAIGPDANVPVTLRLRPERTAAAFISDPRGAPVAGATVRVQAWVVDRILPSGTAGDNWRRHVYRPLRSDADGRVRLGGLSPGTRLLVRVEKPGFAPRTWEGRPSRDLIKIQLHPPGGLAGRVTDASGRALVGAWVAHVPAGLKNEVGRFEGGQGCDQWLPDPHHLGEGGPVLVDQGFEVGRGVSTRTGARGRFALPNLPPGPTRFLVKAPGFCEQIVTVTLPDRSFVAALGRAGLVTGRITKGGKPLGYGHGERVAALRPGTYDPKKSTDEQGPVFGVGVVGRDGRFRVKGLAPGARYDLIAFRHVYRGVRIGDDLAWDLPDPPLQPYPRRTFTRLRVVGKEDGRLLSDGWYSFRSGGGAEQFHQGGFSVSNLYARVLVAAPGRAPQWFRLPVAGGTVTLARLGATVVVTLRRAPEARKTWIGVTCTKTGMVYASEKKTRFGVPDRFTVPVKAGAITIEAGAFLAELTGTKQVKVKVGEGETKQVEIDLR